MEYFWKGTLLCHQYLHGPLSEYADEDLVGLSVVAEEDYTAKDIAEIFGNILECYNYHNITNIGHDIIRALNTDKSLTEKQKTTILKQFVIDFMTQKRLQ